MEEQSTNQQINQSVAPVINSERKGKRGGAVVYFVIIIIAAILIIGGYLTYKTYLMPQAARDSKTSESMQGSEDSDKPFKSKDDLNAAVAEIDKVDLNALSKDLDQNDQDASSFSE